MSDEKAVERQDTVGEMRRTVLREFEDWLETPMLVLSTVWLFLVILELGWGTSHALETLGVAIWIVFLLEFFLRIALAPDKLTFIKTNWLTLISLAAPALRLLRIFRVLRLARFARGLRLVRIVGAANRSMQALGRSMGRRGLGYVLTTTVLVILLGAAGMLAFEPATEESKGFTSYGDAVWWTGMLIMTMGTDFWPLTAEGRLLCFLLALYGFAMFGYITASFASFFVGRDAASKDGEVASTEAVAALAQEIASLRRVLNAQDRLE